MGNQLDLWVKIAVGLLIALVGLKVVDSINPKLGSYYVFAVLLGVILIQRTGFNQFIYFLTGLLGRQEQAGSK